MDEQANIFYYVSVDIIGDDWASSDRCVVYSEDLKNEMIKKYTDEHKNEDGEFIPTIMTMRFSFELLTLLDLKRELTCYEWEQVFDNNFLDWQW